jgi:hypothetical protein
VVGCFNLIYGIAAVANSHVFTANAQYVFGGLRTWGWITLILGAVQLLAAAAAVGRRQTKTSAASATPPVRSTARWV